MKTSQQLLMTLSTRLPVLVKLRPALNVAIGHRYGESAVGERQPTDNHGLNFNTKATNFVDNKMIDS